VTVAGQPTHAFGWTLLRYGWAGLERGRAMAEEVRSLHHRKVG